MNLVVKMEFGSTVYGTSLPTSDKDFKGIFLPTAKDILLQKAPKSFSENTKANSNQRNTADDVDVEMFSLHQFIKLLLEGQTGAVDMLFTPSKHIEFPRQLTDYYFNAGWVWDELQANRSRFLHSGVNAFVGYTQHQAAKYGVKGSRIAAIRATLEWLSQYSHRDKLFTIGTDGIFRHITEIEHAAIVEINGPRGIPEPHLEVCGRKIPFHATVGYAKEVFQRIFYEYGARALLAEKNEGIDWKAIMHAIRVCHEAKELLTTGRVTFPRPEAPLLLQIRKGELPYQQVSELIENGVEEIKGIKSILPEEPDYAFAEDFIEEVYRSVVLDG